MAESDYDLIGDAKARFKEAYDAIDVNRGEMLDDLNFLNGDQWPNALKNDREADGRPCLVINKMQAFVDQVIGDLRRNTPSIVIKPVDDNSDVETADILTGLIRNIQVQSDAEIVYDTAAEHSIVCGEGSFRVITEYSDDDTFDQDIRIRRLKNSFQVFWDPNAVMWDKADARYCFVTERIAKDEFEQLYPDKATMPAEGGRDKDPYWGDDHTIRIAEYWRKKPVKKTMRLYRNVITDEEITTDEELDEMNWSVLREREVDTHKIVMSKLNQVEELEPEAEWPGKLIPIVTIYGKELNIENKTVYRGIIRNAKDPQRLYNYSRSMSAEAVSLAPKAPWLVTAKQIKNYQAMWAQAHKKNFPYLPYNPDPQATGPPQRTFPNMSHTGIKDEIMISDQEMHDTTGLQQSSLGKEGNEKSGKAILARQREGDIGNFVFHDNIARALRHCGRIILELIPHIYDTPKVVRVLGEDEEAEFVPINQIFTDEADGITEKIYDLTAGKYDVVVSVGPSYTTQREESAEMMMEFLRVIPQAAPLIADLLAKNFDWPGAQEIAERLRAMVPPQVLGNQPGGASPGPGGGVSPFPQPPGTPGGLPPGIVPQ